MGRHEHMRSAECFFLVHSLSAELPPSSEHIEQYGLVSIGTSSGGSLTGGGVDSVYRPKALLILGLLRSGSWKH